MSVTAIHRASTIPSTAHRNSVGTTVRCSAYVIAIRPVAFIVVEGLRTVPAAFRDNQPDMKGATMRIAFLSLAAAAALAACDSPRTGPSSSTGLPTLQPGAAAGPGAGGVTPIGQPPGSRGGDKGS
jgi:hypothetical protein